MVVASWQGTRVTDQGEMTFPASKKEHDHHSGERLPTELAKGKPRYLRLCQQLALMDGEDLVDAEIV